MMTTLQLNRFRGAASRIMLLGRSGRRQGRVQPPDRRDCDRGAHDVDRRRARDAAMGRRGDGA